MNPEYVLVSLVGILGGLFVLGLTMYVLFPKAHPEHMQMSPEEESRYELHPTLTPATKEITAENVMDVINDSIESGVEHPALQLRKAQGNDTFQVVNQRRRKMDGYDYDYALRA